MFHQKPDYDHLINLLRHAALNLDINLEDNLYDWGILATAQFFTPTSLKTRFIGHRHIKVVDEKGQIDLPDISRQSINKILQNASMFQLTEYKDFQRLKNI